MCSMYTNSAHNHCQLFLQFSFVVLSLFCNDNNYYYYKVVYICYILLTFYRDRKYCTMYNVIFLIVDKIVENNVTVADGKSNDYDNSHIMGQQS